MSGDYLQKNLIKLEKTFPSDPNICTFFSNISFNRTIPFIKMYLLSIQGCVKFLIPPPHPAPRCLLSLYQIVSKRGREYHGCGEEYNVDIREGEAIS